MPQIISLRDTIAYAAVENGVLKVKDELLKVDFTFMKKDTDGNALNQTTFKFAGGGAETEAVSGTDGVVKFTGLTGGEYTLTETLPAPGYKLKPHVIKVKVDGKGVISFADKDKPITKDELEALFVNEKNSLGFIKKDQYGNVIKGVELTIKDESDPAFELKFNTSDSVNFQTGVFVAEHVYEISEQTRLPGYLNGVNARFKIEKDGTVRAVSGFGTTANDNVLTQEAGKTVLTFRNVKIKGSIEIVKTVEAGAFAGITFDLYKAKGAGAPPVANPDTDTKVNTSPINLDSKGKAAVENLIEGYYYAVETKTGGELCIDTPVSAVIQIGEGQHESVPVKIQMHNSALNLSLELKKVDDTDKSVIPGTEFTLYRVDGSAKTKEATGFTDVNGLLKMKIPGKGKYILAETKAAKGYALNSNQAFEASFTADNTVAFKGKTLDLKQEPSQDTVNLFGLTLKNASYSDKGLTNKRQPGTLTLIKENEDARLDGVTFTLYKKSQSSGFEALWEFITGNTYKPVSETQWSAQAGKEGFLKIEGLSWGEYRIKETKWLPGYVPPKDVSFDFTIGRTNTDMVVSVDLGTIKNPRTKAFISKTTENGTFIPGAVLKLTGNFVNGENELEWTSGAEEKELLGVLLPNESYTLTEVKAPGGYKVIRDSVTLTTDENGNLKDVADSSYKLVNQPIKMLVQKFSPEGLALKGCIFSVTGVFAPLPGQGLENVKGTLTVDDDHKDILEGRLIPGNEYVLKEMTPPSGFVVGGVVRFTVDEDGIVKMLDESTEYEIDENGNIVMTDDPTTMKIAKTGENGEFIGGAEFKLQGKLHGGKTEILVKPDQSGAAVLNELMVEGERYTLTETKAPHGYKVMEEAVVFYFEAGNAVRLEKDYKNVSLTKETVSETIQKNIFTITVKNEKDIPVEPTPTNTPTDKPAPTVSPSQAPSTKPATSANPSSPTTGDSGNTVLWLIAFSALAVTIILLMKRKRERY